MTTIDEDILEKHHPNWEMELMDDGFLSQQWEYEREKHIALAPALLDPTLGTKENPWPISVTALDQPLWWSRKGMSNEEILEELKGDVVETEAMRVGTDFHEAIENIMLGEYFDGESYCRFNFKCDIDLPRVDVTESPLEKVFETPEGWIWLRGKVDGFDGNEIIDYKTKSGKKLTDDGIVDYGDSCQWKSYLWMAGTSKYSVFRYHVFNLMRCREEDDYEGFDKYDVVEHFNLPFYWKDGMENDVIQQAAHCLKIYKMLGWQPRQRRTMAEF